jgi:hypothetical protein
MWQVGYHLHIRNIQGSRIFGSQIRTNKLKLFNGKNVSIMREMHYLKEYGHNIFHSINIVPPMDKIKFQGSWTIITSIDTIFPPKVLES